MSTLSSLGPSDNVSAHILYVTTESMNWDVREDTHLCPPSSMPTECKMHICPHPSPQCVKTESREKHGGIADLIT
jgi:hypothetical protein